RRSGDHVDRHPPDSRGVLRSGALTVERDRSGDQLADQLRTVDRQVDGDGAPHAEPVDVDLLDAEVRQQADHVRGQCPGRKRTVDVVGATVGLEIGRDHRTAGGQPRQYVAELQVDVEQAAVQEKQRGADPFAVNL